MPGDFLRILCPFRGTIQHGHEGLAVSVTKNFESVSISYAPTHNRPSMWLPIIMLAWGVVMIGMGFVRDFKGLLITRVFLGITEAGE